VGGTLFAVSSNPSIREETVEVGAEKTTPADGPAGIGSSTAASTSFFGLGGGLVGGTASAGVMLSPFARDARRRFDTIPLILVGSICDYCAAQSRK
jgi:hypothetical protein